jgi:hypothetical protein
VELYAKHQNLATGYHTGTHSGLAAVLDALIDAAQAQAAADLQHYDHRSLYAFAAALREVIRLKPPGQAHRSVPAAATDR